jgi:hypothetical protein
MPCNSIQNLCIFNALDGLRDGLSHFSGSSRAALVFAVRPTDPMQVYDPQNLLRGHEPKFKELYLNAPLPGDAGAAVEGPTCGSAFLVEKNLQLTGLISCGGRSPSFFYQMWFTDHHPDMCAIGPTERWLEHAAWLLSQDFSSQRGLCTEISGYVLRGYATHAVRDYLLDEMNRTMGWDTSLRVYDILDAVLGISRTREEGAWPRGELVFAEAPALAAAPFLTRFPESERPVLKNFKHVRKLLQAVENSHRKILSDGRYIVGIAAHDLPGNRITADFRGQHGFLNYRDAPVCSFEDGNFHSTTHRANLVQMEEILIDADLTPEVSHDLYRLVTHIVHLAEEQKYGCTLVVDLGPTPIALPGQKLSPPLDLREASCLELASALAKVDGALHIGVDMKLHGFACLLDGLSIPGEDRSRGARFNSALRFTAERPELVVIVVSADRPVSIIQSGVELSAQCDLKPLPGSAAEPPTLARWIEGA